MLPSSFASRTLTRRRLLSFAPAAALMALPFIAQAAVPRVFRLAPEDKADVERVQSYLNGIHTMWSHFEQVSDEGGIAKGQIFIERPGKMRIQYDPPVPVLIVATGGEVYYWDAKLEQLSQVDLDETPAWFLLRNDVRLGGDVTITGYAHDPGVIRVTLIESKHPERGHVTLALSDKPLELRQWTVVDAQAKAATVTLIGPQYGAPINPSFFYWTDPRPQRSSP